MTAPAEDLCHFIAQGPTPFHCIVEAARRLDARGFVVAHEGDRTLGSAEAQYLVRGGTLIAWRRGTDAPASAGFRLIGAHTDSPNLRLKPTTESAREGYLTWGVEPYGGVLLHTWTDRDLGLAGRVVVREPNGSLESRLVRIDRPLARVANLAIHLDREVTERGLILNKQTHLAPLVGLEATGLGALERLLESELGVARDAIYGHDLMLFDLQAPTLGGVGQEFVFAARLDNQASSYMALTALTTMTTVPRATAVVVLFDHEECGSGSERGAASALLRQVLSRLCTEGGESGDAQGGLARAAAHSFVVSADMAHAVHPNYADRHEPQHKPRLNGGPVIKTNVNLRYATDGESAARFRRAAAEVEVPIQQFVTRSDLPCGSTIGPITAGELAMATVDVGCAMLSMHSIREQCGAGDVEPMIRVMRQILET